MKGHIILESENVVKVRLDSSECDVFVAPQRMPISDSELISLVRKYQSMVRRRFR